MNIIRKIITMLIYICFLGGICGCGKEKIILVEDSINNFTINNMEVSGVSEEALFAVNNNKIYCLEGNKIKIIDCYNQKLTERQLEKVGEDRPLAFCIDAKENIYVISKSSLSGYSPQGDCFLETAIKELNFPDDNIPTVKMDISEDGKIYFTEWNKPFLYMYENGKVKNLSLNEPSIMFISDLIIAEEETLILHAYTQNADGTKGRLFTYKENDGHVKELSQLPDDLQNSSFYQSSNNNYLIVGDTTLYKSNSDFSKIEALIEWNVFGLYKKQVLFATQMEDETIVLMENTEEGESISLAYLKPAVMQMGETDRNEDSNKANASLPTDKVVLKIAIAHSSNLFEKAVIDFNQLSDNYKIEIVDYSNKKSLEEEIRMDAELLNNQGADMFVFATGSYGFHFEDYKSKGILADISYCFDEATQTDISSFIPNLIDACESEGEILQYVPFFSVSTVAAKTSIVGDKVGWSLEEAFQLLDEQNPGTFLWVPTPPEIVVMGYIQRNPEDFMDVENKICSFTSDNFIRLLEKVKKLYGNNEGFEDYQKDCEEDRILLLVKTIKNTQDVQSCSQWFGGVPVTLIGQPCKTGNGAYFEYEMGIGINKKSLNKEGCKEFIQFLMRDDYQHNIGKKGFPVKIDILEEKLKQDMTVSYEIDKNGKQIEVPAADKETIEKVKELVYNTNKIRVSDAYISIVGEELQAYFYGEKSAKETAEIIQSRVSLYLKE